MNINQDLDTSANFEAFYLSATETNCDDPTPTEQGSAEDPLNITSPNDLVKQENEDSNEDMAYVKKVMVKQDKNWPTEKPYKCKICNYETTFFTNLKVHLRVHTGEKPYQCPECNRSCNTTSSLKRHRRIHTGEKPYKCSECQYQCRNFANLKRHVNIVHIGEKPYKCGRCEFFCGALISLQRHMSVHTGKKTYQCKWCDFSTFNKKTFENHVVHHSDRESSPD